MKKIIALSTLALIISATNNAQAIEIEKTNTNETPTEVIGFGSGAIAGTMIAGPVGGFVGGILGLFIGNDMSQDKALISKEKDIFEAHALLAQQEMHINKLQEQYANLQQSQEEKLEMMQLVNMEQSDIYDWQQGLPALESNVQFKTASFLIEDTYKAQLDTLANLLAQYPELSVKLSGFADARGDSQYNRILSQQRAKAVKEHLLSKNVQAEQIVAIAQGEIEKQETVTPDSDTYESLFFDRRVTINIVNQDNTMTAAN